MINRLYAKNGFTIAELTVVIVVVAILAGLVVISYSWWRESIAENAVKSDLEIVKSSMTNARNFGEAGYPTFIPASFTSGENVSIIYVSGTPTGYCIEGRSTSYTSIVWHVQATNNSTVISEGPC